MKNDRNEWNYVSLVKVLVYMTVLLLLVLGRKEKQLRNKFISLVMVQWSKYGREEVIWELGEKMQREW